MNSTTDFDLEQKKDWQALIGAGLLIVAIFITLALLSYFSGN